MKYPVHSTKPENRCLECNEVAPRSKRFCNDEHEVRWLQQHHPWHPDWRGVIAMERERQGITPEALDWRRKLSLSRPF